MILRTSKLDQNMISSLLSLLLVICCFYMCSSLRLKRQTLQLSLTHPTPNSFIGYWNVPLHKCKSSKNFEPILNNFGIKHNKGLKFEGEQIVLLYDPGEFPIVENNQDINGGVPQSGNFSKHIIKFGEVINIKVPNIDFDGVGVIDFEVWRPVFRQNWKQQEQYKTKSINLQKNSSLTKEIVEKLAKIEFEEGARTFMEGTSKEAKKLRPNAVWGYYGFPHCYNQYNTDIGKCVTLAEKENDGTQWLFEESTALYPSVYMNESITGPTVEKFVSGRLNEAQRLWQQRTKKDPALTLPYVWHKYKESDNFLTPEDLENVLKTIKKYNMGGFIIWASSSDFPTEKNCTDYLDYVNNTIGPVFQKVQNLNVI